MNNIPCRPLGRWGALALLCVLLWAPLMSYAQGGEFYHVVQPGENLFRISLRYGLSLETLMQANGLTDASYVYVGQRLLIPGQASLPPTPAPGLADTLPVLSASATPGSAGVSLALTASPTLTLPLIIGGRPTPGPESTPAVQVGPTIHIVQPGENLYRIGLRYGLTAQAVAWANGLANEHMVYVGQQLAIPAPGSVPAGPPPGVAPSSPSAIGKHIVVVLSEQRVYVYENGQLLRSMWVSTGLPGTPTVRGNFQIYARHLSQLMTGPGYYLPNVPYVMYFYQGYSFHGTYWHSNFGQPMSHGCVNMLTSDAAWLYDWAPIGTAVTVR